MRWIRGTILLLAIIVGGTPVVAVELRATVVDRDGNRFEVTNFKYEGQDAFPMIVSDKRTMVKFKEVKQIEFRGAPNDETQPVLVVFLDGRTSQGEVFVGGSGRIVGTGGSVSAQMAFTGNTSLGKFRLSLKRVKEVIFHPVQTVMRCPTDGRTFEQEGYTFCPYDGMPLEHAKTDTLRGEEKGVQGDEKKE
ncbi:MAG: hypothetical protein HY709_08200 [Candidatus Latescibacteria bacterium]|nr:hypothetical protein [Candidatus Latescibacterota bacterium]